MAQRITVGNVIWFILIIVAGSIVVGHLLGQPILLSYVRTGSMAPTLQPGDGFIAVPMAIAGPVKENDVIVFEAQNLHGGGLVTHRVVRRTDRGFITRGDANPFTDQESSSNEPPVKREQIVAKALQVGGRVVVIPQIGVPVAVLSEGVQTVQSRLAQYLNIRGLLGAQGLAYILLGIGAIAYILSIIFAETELPTRERARNANAGIDPKLIVAALTVILLVLVTASMTIPSGPQEFEIISSERDSPGPRVIAAGTTETTTYRIPSNGLLPVVVFLEPSGTGIDVAPTEAYVPGNEQVTATVALHAPPQTGYYSFYVTEHRYIAILPRGVIRALYQIHPGLPIVAIDAVLGIAFTSAGLALLGFRPVRARTRDSGTTLTKRVLRWLR